VQRAARIVGDHSMPRIEDKLIVPWLDDGLRPVHVASSETPRLAPAVCQEPVAAPGQRFPWRLRTRASVASTVTTTRLQAGAGPSRQRAEVRAVPALRRQGPGRRAVTAAVSVRNMLVNRAAPIFPTTVRLLPATMNR
jgi:hypothetical protein